MSLILLAAASLATCIVLVVLGLLFAWSRRLNRADARDIEWDV